MDFAEDAKYRLQLNGQPSLKDPPAREEEELHYDSVSIAGKQKASPDFLVIYDEDLVESKKKEERLRKTLLFVTCVLLAWLLWTMLF